LEKKINFNQMRIYMKNTMTKSRKIILALAAVLSALFIAALSSCYIPNPLYGTWTDSNGDQYMTLLEDGTFSAKIANSDDSTTEYSGEWTTVDNILILSIKGSTNYQRNIVWSLNGAILYLDWTSEDKTEKSVTLYHTAR